MVRNKGFQENKKRQLHKGHPLRLILSSFKHARALVGDERSLSGNDTELSGNDTEEIK